MSAYSSHRVENIGNPTESLTAYLKDIQGTEKLTGKDERALAARIRKGDRSAMKTLVEANLKFVVLVCLHYKNRGMPLADLINEGNLGLIRAALRFDETRDFKFISYAVWWIRQSVMDALSKQTHIISAPPNAGAFIHKINKASLRLAHQLGRRPSPEELELEIGMNAKRIREFQRVSEPVLSLDFESQTENPNLSEMLADDSESGSERETIRFEAKETTEWLMEQLSPREREVLALYFGTRNGSPMGLREIGSRFEMSKERVRQIKNGSLRKMKRILQEMA